MLHAAMGQSTGRSKLPSPSVTPYLAAAAGQHYPALEATTSFARSRLSPQPAKVQMHKAVQYQQPSMAGSFSFHNSAFVFRPQTHTQVPVMVSVVSQQASGGLGLYGISRRNLLSVVQQRLMGTDKLVGKRANQLLLVLPKKSSHRSQKVQPPAQM